MKPKPRVSDLAYEYLPLKCKNCSSLGKLFSPIRTSVAHFAEVVSYAADMNGGNLPLSQSRTKAEGKITGKAAQAFNAPTEEGGHYVGYIMGNLILPPKGIKDPESVGPCAQTFTVCRCQPKAMEVSFGDPEEPDGELDPETAQRFLLSPGDMFRVPPGNSYRLHNHSESEEALLTWTIIRPKEDGGGR